MYAFSLTKSVTTPDPISKRPLKRSWKDSLYMCLKTTPISSTIPRSLSRSFKTRSSLSSLVLVSLPHSRKPHKTQMRNLLLRRRSSGTNLSGHGAEKLSRTISDSSRNSFSPAGASSRQQQHLPPLSKVVTDS